jgi:tetratricopeptide (TPR) repeat protein
MIEEQLLNKTFYQSFMEPNEQRHPLQVLGEAYLKEHRKEMPDLSYIRFAQGEVYFQAKDFEAAIFKWENINNELEPWAKKNMADAYYELELYSTAEKIYQSIASESLTLQTEVAIQLFSLYVNEKKLDLAVHMIKQAVAINPDYENVTQMAQLFFEEQKDWDNALELAVNEALRTNGLEWFDTITNYVESGYTKHVEPNYFSQALLALKSIDSRRFESLAAALWNSYRNGDFHFIWLKEFNRLFEQFGESIEGSFRTLSGLFRKTYLSLLDGQYLIKEIADIVPNLLINWVKIAAKDDENFAAAAVLAWHGVFESSIPAHSVDAAEKILSRSDTCKADLNESLTLFQSVVRWAEEQELVISPKLKWAIEKLSDLNTQYLLVAGDSSNEKTAFFRRLIGETPLESACVNVLYTDHETEEVFEMTDSGINHASSLSEESGHCQDIRQVCWREVKRPNVFLRENHYAFIHPAELNEQNEEPLFVADRLVFLVNEKEPFTETERKLFLFIQKRNPDLPVHFLVMKDENAFRDKTEDLAAIINSYFPAAKMFSFSPGDSSWGVLQQLADFLNRPAPREVLEQERAVRVLYFVRRLLNDFLDKRVKLETSLVESVNWNMQMVGKLTGAINQLADVKSETVRLIQKMYQQEKEKIRSDVLSDIPKLLKECSLLINEDSDFRKIHLDLNKEMNFRIETYINETVLPKFQHGLQNWIEASGAELEKIQAHLKEQSDGFNALFEEERLRLECDFRVLDDWRRDVFRMTSSFHLGEVNILLRMTPAQVLLKSAGKLLGVIAQNKKMLCNKYKQFIENENYKEIAESVASKLLQQFELFEKGLERDIAMFFASPESVLNKLVEEMNEAIAVERNQLNEMDANPERFNDPLTLFHIRLRQYEWLLMVKPEIQFR